MTLGKLIKLIHVYKERNFRLSKISILSSDGKTTSDYDFHGFVPDSLLGKEIDYFNITHFDTEKRKITRILCKQGFSEYMIDSYLN